MKKVSVIVPAYNAEKYIEKCLDSLVDQTLKDIEIIVINDGSKDRTKDILEEYEKNYEIKVIHNKNHGIGYSRNQGIKLSTAKYIAFVDSDDWVSVDTYEKMYNYAEKEKLDMVVCDYTKYYEINNTYEKTIINDFGICNLKENKNILLDINYSPWNKLYKKEILTNNNILFEENLKYEDMPFTIKAIINANKIGKLNECLNYYLIRGKSETTTMDKKVYDMFEILKIITNSLQELDYYESISDVVEYVNIRNIFRYTLQQKYQKEKSLKNKFINDAFDYLNNNFPDYKNNKYLKQRPFIKRLIESNKTITKIYCKI